ncbi:hypothetical protein MHYP_G00206980 [Metynnis hypsauchen]
MDSPDRHKVKMHTRYNGAVTRMEEKIDVNSFAVGSCSCLCFWSRRENRCLKCFAHGHWKKDCPKQTEHHCSQPNYSDSRQNQQLN